MSNRGGLFGTRAGDLIWRCLDGVASETEAAELNLLVLRDPAIARELARAARMERSLEVASRAATGEIPAPAPPPVARAPRRMTGIALGAGIAVVAAGLVFTWFLRERPGSAPRSAPAPIARAVPQGSPAASARPTPAVPRETARRLRFADGSTAELRDEASHIETRVSTAKAMDFVLVHGAARFEVVPLPGRRFRVWVSASTYVEVVGTVFSVERLPAGVRVSVERGTVKVVSPRHETRISAGTAEVIAFESPRARDATTDRAPPDRVKQHASDTAATALARNEASDLLGASGDARRARRPEEAAALLQRFLDRHAHDPRAGYAAFILGRVLLEELARPGEAAAAFARVGVLDPRTPLVEDALAREVESLSRAGDTARAQERARAYLDRYPDGARAEEVRRYSRMK